MLKTPITYYGGKQRLLKHILPLIPKHTVYNEPFFGGGAVFFAKKPVKCEMINDINDRVVNFYKVYQNNPEELIQRTKESLLSRSQYYQARKIYQSPNGSTDIEKAWAFWFLGNTSFNGDYEGNIKFSRSDQRSYAYLKNSKLNLMDSKVISRIEHTQIDNRDALLVIAAMDQPKTFHFIDPPYIDAYQGHYSGYTKFKFARLLVRSKTIKGKFLLTCYPGKLIELAVKKYGWKFRKVKIKSAASSLHGKNSIKTEMLVFNYNLDLLQKEIDFSQTNTQL